MVGWNVWVRLTKGRDSPDLTPGRHRIQTFSAPSRLFRDDLAGWTVCEGTGSLKSITRPRQRKTKRCFCQETETGGQVKLLLPFRVSPSLHTPSTKFFLTTFFTSSNAWGCRGLLKHVRCHRTLLLLKWINRCGTKNRTFQSVSEPVANN